MGTTENGSAFLEEGNNMAAPFVLGFMPDWCGSIYINAQRLQKYQDFSKIFQNY